MITAITVNPQKFQEAVSVLENAGHTVTFAPIELWSHRCVLTAFNPVTGEGYLIGSDELGLLCHYGIAYLNPHNFSEPRYKAKDNVNRLKHYAEAVLARAIVDIQTAQPGTRNQTLYKAAFVIGRYLLGWHLDPDSVQAQLLDAALQSGLQGGEREARTTIKSGLKAGQKQARDPDDLMNNSPFDEHPSSSNKSQALSSKNRFDEQHHNPLGEWAKPSPWGW
ncbi:MAG: hypothetical protein ACRCYY_00360 [Trueperaceae bacterium]